MQFTISLSNPMEPQVRGMISESDRYYARIYPADSNHLLDVSALCASNVSFFVARDVDAVLGFGSLVAFENYGEIKRMYVDQSARGNGIGRRLLLEIESKAKDLKLPCLRLETGIRQPEAVALYKSHAFREIGPFGDYKPDPLSLFMEKRIA